MRILNRVSPGEAITAQAWNALVECCMEMQSELQRRRLSVGDGLELSESSCGTTLSLDVGDYGDDDAAGQEHPFKVTARVVTNDEGKQALKVKLAEGRVFVDERDAPMSVANPFVMADEWEVENPPPGSYKVYFTRIFYNNNESLRNRFEYEVTAEDPAEAMMQGYARDVLSRIYGCFPFTLTPRLPYGRAVLSGTKSADSEKEAVDAYVERVGSKNLQGREQIVVAQIEVDSSGGVSVVQKLKNDLFLTHFHGNT